MWNDTDIPIAYLITFRSYGTWLHGDERGSIDRFHNQYKTPLIAPNLQWRKYNSAQMKSNAVIFDKEQREIIEKSIRETCDYRQWSLHAVNVRTNHVHAVVSIGAKKPEIALNAFKANAARNMRDSKCLEKRKSPWSDKGSKRYLWNEKSVALAVEYVLYGQGEELPEL